MATGLLHDIKYGTRLLLRGPALTALVVVSLALGIGANTTIFTLVHAVLLQPLPVRDPSRLVTIFTRDDRNAGPGGPLAWMSRPNFIDVRDLQDVFSGVVAAAFATVNLSGTGEPEQVLAQVASSDYFDVLGAPFAVGRGFPESDDESVGSSRVAVLTHGLWQRRFGGRPDVVGTMVTINRQPFTVVGVTAAGFRGTTSVGGPELWVPMAMFREVTSGFTRQNWNWRRALLFQVHGRLRDEVSIAEAQARLSALGKHLEDAFPDANRSRSISVVPLAQSTLSPGLRRNVSMAAGLSMVIVAIVLLIACGNVANLLLARATARRHEIAVRLALGSGRARLVRQVLTESLMLAGLGGLGGLVVAFWARDLLWTLRPPSLQMGALDLSFDPSVLVFTAAVSIATGILFGMMPALRSSRTNIVDDLKDRSNAPGGHSPWNVRNALVVGQVTLSFVTLVSAGLFLRSLSNAQRIDPGLDVDRLVIATLSPALQGYDEPQGRDLYRRVLARAASIAGVDGVALAANAPLLGGGVLRTVFKDGQDMSDLRAGRLTQTNHVSARYFSVAGIPILRGRAFVETDRAGARPVAIINESMAAQYWPDEEAVGQQFRFLGNAEPLQIIGIASDSTYNSVGDESVPFIYMSLEQAYAPSATLFLRTAADPAALVDTVRRELRQLEPTMPIPTVAALRSVFHESLWAQRMGVWLLSIFAGLALLLAAIGLYGVMACAVSQRTRELGIRLALGASHHEVRHMVVRQGLFLALAGVAIGFIVAFALARLVTKLLFGVNGTDPMTFTIIPLVLLLVALVATYFPAWRASRVDPVEALRV